MEKISNKSFTVGLTGGIASGKSSVTRHFESLGVPVVDADLVAREVVQPGSPYLDQLREIFGPTILQPDGHLDRSALRSIVFDDPQAREQLEDILHPAIRKRSAELVEQHSADNPPYVICAVPLLVETGQQHRYHRIAVVDVSRKTQISRIMSRDHSTASEAEKILAAQASRDERLAIADDVIHNEGTLADLQEQVNELHLQYLAQAANRVQVVAGVIFSSDRQSVLLARRPADKHQGGLWEFPGGKIEVDETHYEALGRELKEEIDITPSDGKPLMTIDHRYPDKWVTLNVWEINSFSGNPIGLEHQELRWVRLAEIDQFEFPAANLEIVAWLASQ